MNLFILLKLANGPYCGYIQIFLSAHSAENGIKIVLMYHTKANTSPKINIEVVGVPQ